MKVHIQTPICNTGYGIAGINIIKALREIKPKAKSSPEVFASMIGSPDPQMFEEIKTEAHKAIYNFDNYVPIVKIWHQHQLFERPGKGTYYGFPIFELDTFVDLEKASLKAPDQLLVCSKWAAQIIEEQTGRKCDIVPLGVDDNIFNGHIDFKEDNSYNFFTIGKLEYRKGHDFIVNCFNKAFEKNDDVKLNMMINNFFLDPQIMQKWYSNFKDTKIGQKINFYNSVNSHQQIADFIKQQDCGLFPSRAEGWNLELLESMACNKKVITTNYSGHTEFCNNENSYLIDIDEKELAYDKMDGLWFRGQGNWAKLDENQEEQMIEYMRICYKENKRGNFEGLKTAANFSWENTAKKLLSIIYDIPIEEL